MGIYVVWIYIYHITFTVPEIIKLFSVNVDFFNFNFFFSNLIFHRAGILGDSYCYGCWSEKNKLKK
jgi:hypothetical protein